VDCPRVRGATVERLLEAFHRLCPPGLLVIPRCGGRRGHPVCCAPRLADEFLALPRDGQARTVIHARKDETGYLDLEDPGILDDIDTPEDYRQLLEAPGRA